MTCGTHAWRCPKGRDKSDEVMSESANVMYVIDVDDTLLITRVWREQEGYIGGET